MGCAPTRDSKIKKVKVSKEVIEKSSSDFKSDSGKDLKKKLILKSARIIEKNISPYSYYNEVAFIGEGKYGKVYKVIHKETNKLRAMKVLAKRNNISKSDEDEIVSEFTFLRDLDHPNIVKVYELFDFNDSYYFVSELVDGGSLTKKLEDVKVFKESQVSHMLFQILSAVSFCHANKIIHKDLNLDNILILDKVENLEHFTVKIVDFGSSQKVFDPEYYDLFGTPIFMSPEAIDGEITEKGDSWACGVIAYILLVGDIPFYNTNEDEMLNDLITGNFNKTNPFWEKLSSPAQEFIQKLLDPNPDSRLSVSDAIDLKFIDHSRKRSKIFLNNDRLRIIANKILKNTDNNKILIKAATSYIVHNLLKSNDTEIFRKIFNELNTSNDGRLTKSQVEKGFKNVMNMTELDDFVKRTFENIDDDNNGFIEFEEFVAGCLDKKKFFTPNNIQHAFKFLSSYSKEGKIKYSDLKRLIISKQNDDFQEKQMDPEDKKKEDELIRKAIEEVDNNEDGEISYEEFNKVMMEDAGNTETHIPGM
mmetsp:Transcript_27992/g.29177  ORF Transcript_27992/g.29177 Transcript_27992/m.29177 type:complete len:533 (-) Transcript_27992:40-1638(-)